MILLGKCIVASQDGPKCLDIGGELSVDEDLVRTLRRCCMRFFTLERYDAIAAVEDPSGGPEWRTMTGILSVQHDRPAVAEVELDHIISSLTTNLESDGFFQAVRKHKCCKFLEEVGADARKVIDSTLDVFVCDKAILANEHKDMTMHLPKIDFFQRCWFGPATGGICEVLAQHHISSTHFGVAVNEVDSESVVDIVLDKNVRETLKVQV